MLGSRTQSGIATEIRDIMATNVATDGLIFDADSIKAERIVEDADYEGVRVRFLGLQQFTECLLNIR